MAKERAPRPADEAAQRARWRSADQPTKLQLMVLKSFAWLEDRFLLRQFVTATRAFVLRTNLQFPLSHTERYKLRIIWYWYPLYTLGALSALTFLVAAVSGILLAFYYNPSAAPADCEAGATEAWCSVRDIMLGGVPFGHMLRQIHFWSAMIMVAAVFMHMLRVYFTQAYKKPRELNWIIGFLLLVFTLGLGYTGYLLPWSQLSYWAATIGLEMSLASPLIGEYIANLLFGSELGQATLIRMYVLHVIVLPLIVVGTIVAHIVIVWIQGIAEPH